MGIRGADQLVKTLFVQIVLAAVTETVEVGLAQLGGLGWILDDTILQDLYPHQFNVRGVLKLLLQRQYVINDGG